jgi:hypothetical protein
MHPSMRPRKLHQQYYFHFDLGIVLILKPQLIAVIPISSTYIQINHAKNALDIHSLTGIQIITKQATDCSFSIPIILSYMPSFLQSSNI